MTPQLSIVCGDALTELRKLADNSVHCVVTSPPYWGLRDYGVAGQLGLESTPAEYVAKMVEVFREVRRVLRTDGTLWLNLGDSYARDVAKGGSGPNGKHDFIPDYGNARKIMSESKGSSDGVVGRAERAPVRVAGDGLKPKDLVGIPWRVAFALQQPYYTGQIPDERDRTWLAALMDGEGTFTILSTASPHGSGNSYPPIAQVRMTSAGVVAKAATLVGVASPAQYPPSSRGNRAVYQWRLSGRRAADIARELYPYLIEKRKQALIAWNHQEVRDGYTTKRGVTIPSEALAKQLVCRDLIRRLNRAEHVDIPSWMTEPPPLFEPGWYLRSDVIWSKPNPMPESVNDRPTKSHEYLFLLAKSPRYYYDAEAIKEPANGNAHSRITAKAAAEIQQARDRGLPPCESNPLHAGVNPKAQTKIFGVRSTSTFKQAATLVTPDRNRRSVWTIATQPYSEAHFATFPEDFVKPCILAGTSERGVCASCGAPWQRVVQRIKGEVDSYNGSRFDKGKTRDARNGLAPVGAGERTANSVTTGWQPSCRCSAGVVPATVLDPFAGSCTVAQVALELGRSALMIELNPRYVDLGRQRTDVTPGLAIA